MACRNPSLKKKGKKARFTSTIEAIDTVINKITVDAPATNSLAALSLSLTSEWEMKLFKTDSPAFLTCDNPGTFLKSSDDHFSAVLLPLSPTRLFIAARKRELTIFRDQLTEKEISAANTYATINSHRMVFSYEEFEVEQLPTIRFLKGTNRHQGELGDTKMRLSTLTYPIEALPLPLNFLAPKVPKVLRRE